MGNRIAKIILSNRISFLAILLIITVFMGYHATKVEMSYTFVRPLPNDDPALINYDKFRKLFGEDAGLMVLGFSDTTFFQTEKFNRWLELTQDIKNISGIKEVLSCANLYTLTKVDSLSKFKFNPILKDKVKNQAEMDSIQKLIYALPFYEGILYNQKTGAHVMLITFKKDELNSARRIEIVKEIEAKAKKYGEINQTEVNLSGMPYIRTRYMLQISQEMKLFLILAVAITAFIVFFIFRSVRTVFFSLILVSICIIWSLGTMALLEYKITVLSGLIPSIITVIGLPNCVFIINKYQVELTEHGDKETALRHSISKVILSNFLANVTTAIGFIVFWFTHSTLLEEFGIVTALNVMTTYAAAHILMPIILSYTKTPSVKQMNHLSGKNINRFLEWMIILVERHRMKTYITVTLITAVAFFGWKYIELNGYVVDDLPKRDPIYTNLKFFEKHFNGVLPFEVCVDTKQPNGVFGNDATTLYKIKALQKEMQKYPEFSKPVSVVEALKFAYQSYNDGKEKFYILPGIMELNKLKDYTQTQTGNATQYAAFMDSTKQYTRVSFQMADVGSKEMNRIVNEIRPKVDSIFPTKDYDVQLTGNSLVFLKGNDYLFHHLFIALLIAIVLILLLGMVLFRSVAIIVLSKLPCLIPLVITAGIMGYFGINFKPSTIIVFTIAFGLSSDGTIYILTEYWLQLRKKNPNAISDSIREVGVSMIYTAAILFFGFAIFIASNFGGTVALGVLMSVTVAVAMFTNLILLPSFLASLEKLREKRRLKKQNI